MTEEPYRLDSLAKAVGKKLFLSVAVLVWMDL